jgi:hypothetical protein
MRGHMHWGERFIKELSSRYVPIKVYNKVTGQIENKIWELRVSPIMLYDVVFPDEIKDAVMNTILNGGTGEASNPALKKYVWSVRKMMGLKKIDPNYKKEIKLPMSPPEHCEIIAIGEKDDYWIEPDGTRTIKEKKSPLAVEGL